MARGGGASRRSRSSGPPALSPGRPLGATGRHARHRLEHRRRRHLRGSPTSSGPASDIPANTPPASRAAPAAIPMTRLTMFRLLDLTFKPPWGVTTYEDGIRGIARSLPEIPRRAPRPGARVPASDGGAGRCRRLLSGDVHGSPAQLREPRRRQPARLGDDDRAQQGDRPPPRPGPRAIPKADRAGGGGFRPAERDPELWAAVGRAPATSSGPRSRCASPPTCAYREVAAAMDTSEEAARRNVHEGLRKLRETRLGEGAGGMSPRDEIERLLSVPGPDRWTPTLPTRRGASPSGPRPRARPRSPTPRSTRRSGSPAWPRPRGACSSVGLPSEAVDDFLDSLAERVSPQHRRGARDPGRRPPRAGRVLQRPARDVRPAARWRLVPGGVLPQGPERDCRSSRSGSRSTYGEIAAQAGNDRAHRAGGDGLGLEPASDRGPVPPDHQERGRPRQLRRRPGAEEVAAAPPRVRSTNLDSRLGCQA